MLTLLDMYFFFIFSEHFFNYKPLERNRLYYTEIMSIGELFSRPVIL